MVRVFAMFACVVCALCLQACRGTQERCTMQPRAEWAIVLHGGAGVIDRDTPPERVREYTDSLARALAVGIEMLESGRPALDAVEAVVMTLEDDEKFNAGRGAVFTAEGRNELDASIMDGATLRCGAVAGVTTVKNPVRLARRVMERTRHVLLSREGAEAFADSLGPDIARVDPSYFFTTRRWRVLEEVLKERGEPMPPLPKGVTLSAADEPPAKQSARVTHNPTFGTVGCVALDRSGNLAAATSTGGMSGKRWARIGDSPIIGAGNYANNASCAVSGTGTGEEFIRHGVARDISDRMLYKGVSLNQAAREVVHGVLRPDDGGIIAVSRSGEIAMVFNSDGMFRAAADATGRLEVGIWERPEMQASGAR
jgi:beta-aspartyl-peptidase (threonine type)